MGFTAKEIFIGYAYDSTFERRIASVGANAAAGDQQAVVKTVVKGINAKGGMAGRKVVPVFHDTNGGQQSNRTATAQAACAKFTEDHRVFAAISTVSEINNDTLFSCLAGRHARFVGGIGSWYDSTDHLSRFADSLFLPNGAAIERLAPIWIQRLAALGYFDGGWDVDPARPGPEPTKIGLLYGNNGDTSAPIAEAFAQSVERALVRQGRGVAIKLRTTGSQNEADQAAIRLRNARVTHVIGDASLVPFVLAAGAQNYRPRYGLSTFSIPGALMLLAPPGQLRGALGVGYMPFGDVDNPQDPPGDISPAETHCREIMKKDGHDTTQRLAWGGMANACDLFNFIKNAIEKGGLTPEAFRAGLQAMGSMPPASTFKISFPGSRPDGLSAVRDLAYRDTCPQSTSGCFAYVSTANHAL